IGVVFNTYLRILVKLCKFLAHPLNGHFKKLIPRRFLMSSTKRSRIAIIHLQKSLPLSAALCTLRITNGACVRMLKAGVQMTFDQLALASPKGFSRLNLNEATNYFEPFSAPLVIQAGLFSSRPPIINGKNEKWIHARLEPKKIIATPSSVTSTAHSYHPPPQRFCSH
uniref:Large ribosomal subunit protein uL15/eL18 domain-containing protein n=1 Tax=Neolamprologus brichardi TaxID=32507 RepID=A0A3Q4GUH7_NEOBR